tara:strand:- start:9268 stop:9534 length:267 start_codon:yes stop_codon:yes gene_type:complete
VSSKQQLAKEVTMNDNRTNRMKIARRIRRVAKAAGMADNYSSSKVMAREFSVVELSDVLVRAESILREKQRQECICWLQSLGWIHSSP